MNGRNNVAGTESKDVNKGSILVIRVILELKSSVALIANDLKRQISNKLSVYMNLYKDELITQTYLIVSKYLIE